MSPKSIQNRRVCKTLCALLLALLMLLPALGLAEEAAEPTAEPTLEEILDMLADDGTESISLPEQYRISVGQDALNENESLSPDWLNVLLLGVDDRSINSMSGRTDTMLLVSVNTRTSEVKLTSFLRDLYVTIDGVPQPNRLNVCNVLGGPNLLMQTINRTFDMNINAYIMINFANFTKIIDKIGGVDMYVTSEEIRSINSYAQDYLRNVENTAAYAPISEEAGGQVLHLDGIQAVSYTRNRTQGTDFRRTERQRALIMAIFDALTRSSVDEVVGLIPTALESVSTNLTLRDLLSVCIGLITSADVSFQTHVVPVSGAYQDQKIRGMDVLVPNVATNTAQLHEFIYGAD